MNDEGSNKSNLVTRQRRSAEDRTPLSVLICNHHNGEMQVPVEHTDWVGWHNLDVRQETAIDVITELRSRGIEPTSETLPELIEGMGGCAVTMHQTNMIDAIRSLKGRTIRRGVAAPLDDAAEVFDASSEEALAEIENDFEGQLKVLWNRATKSEKRAIGILLEWQYQKTMGNNTDHLRQALYDVKKTLKKQGSTFNPNPRLL